MQLGKKQKRWQTTLIDLSNFRSKMTENYSASLPLLMMLVLHSDFVVILDGVQTCVREKRTITFYENRRPAVQNNQL